MNKILQVSKFAALLMGASLSLTSCGQSVDYKEHLGDYFTMMSYKEDFTIVQLTDLHWSNLTDMVSAKAYIEKLLCTVKKERGHIDMLEFSGDQFMLASKATVKEFIQMTTDYQIPYGIVWGNHDFQGNYSRSWLISEFLNAPYCLLKGNLSDNLDGDSNYVVNLVNGGHVAWQIYHLDSLSFLTENAFSPVVTYESLKESQFDFVSQSHIGSTPGMMMYHIPQYAMFDAREHLETYPNKFFMHESVSNPKTCTTNIAHETWKANDIKLVMMGHDHANDWTVNYDGITMGYGVKSSKELYYTKITAEEAFAGIGLNQAFDLMGATIITLKSDSTFDLEHLYVNENNGGDFVHWEKF